MSIVNTLSLNSNRKIKINFNGGDLSYDSGMLLIHEFAQKLGLEQLLEQDFSTNDNKTRKHTDSKNAIQKVYQLIAGYFQDDDADELTSDPIFTTILNKRSLASQPTLSRFINRCDEICLYQFELIHQKLRERIYSWKRPDHLLIDIDSTLFATFGTQEGNSFNSHYRDYPDIPLYLRGDSGFADIMIYETLESNGVSYAIRMKENGRLRSAASFIEDELFTKTKDNQIDYAVSYGEFFYKADSWLYPRRIVCKIEKPEGQMNFLYTFIVTNMDGSPEDLICFYCKRGLMETFIRESKHGFHMDAMSSHSMTVNVNKLQISMLAYNLFNWFRRLVLPRSFQKLQVDTIRLKLLKIAAKLVRSARYLTFKLCSYCPYKNEFYKTLDHICELKQQE